MEMEALNTKSKILQTAIDIVGVKGEFTIREIAEKSGVNVAAINYYFGNKSNLLKEVENFYSERLYNIQHEILEDHQLTSFEKLTTWAKSLIEFMFKSPALIGLIVNIVNEDKSYKPLLIQRIYLNQELKTKIEAIIKEHTGITDQRVLDCKYLQIFSGVLGPVISQVVSSTFGEGQGIFDITSREELDRYIQILIIAVLAK